MKADIRDQMIALLPRLRRFARAIAGPQAADDLVQGAVERALRAIHQWTPGTRLDSWMFRILRNLWLDDLRVRRPQLNVDEMLEQPGDDGRATMEGRSELAKVRSLIGVLPVSQREVLTLVCVEDLTYRETAEILGVPIGTVMSRLARARRALADGLDGQMPHRSSADAGGQ